MKDIKFKNILQSIESDTGFNVICLCCAEYKSRNQYTGIQVLKENQQQIYLPRDMKRLASKDRKMYIILHVDTKLMKVKA